MAILGKVCPFMSRPMNDRQGNDPGAGADYLFIVRCSRECAAFVEEPRTLGVECRGTYMYRFCRRMRGHEE